MFSQNFVTMRARLIAIGVFLVWITSKLDYHVRKMDYI